MQPLLKMIPRVEDSSYEYDSDNTTSNTPYTSNRTLWTGLAATTAFLAVGGAFYYYYWHNNTTNNNATTNESDIDDDL